jgi:hypothetical protein
VVVPFATVPVIVAAFVFPTSVVAVTTFAVKFPVASRATIVDTPLAEFAVVAEFGMDVMDAPLPIKVVALTVVAFTVVALTFVVVKVPVPDNDAI